MKKTRKIAIIGAGLAGSSAALAFQNNGFSVSLYSDKTQLALRDQLPATGTAIYFGKKSQEADSLITENLYNESSFTDGCSMRIYNEENRPLLSFDANYHYYRAQAVDVRLRVDNRLEHFINSGGKFYVKDINHDELDAIALQNDLTLIATGKQGLADLFEVDADRTVYHSPQRYLLSVNVTGLPHGPNTFSHRSQAGSKHNLITDHATQGEIFTGPLLHKDIGESWALLAFAKPDSDWQKRFGKAKDAASALAVFQKIFHDYFPEDVTHIDKLHPIESDENTWLKGAVTPTVRKAVGRTKNGQLVAALGDTAISFDPIAGQGAQNISIQIASLVQAAKSHEGTFDAEWIEKQFDTHWQQHGYGATEVTRLFLGDPKYAEHIHLFLVAASVNPKKGGAAFFRLLSEPELINRMQTEDSLKKYIEEETGKSIESLSKKFLPATSFSTAEVVST